MVLEHSAVPTELSRGPHGERLRALVVDDSPDIRALGAAIVEALGFKPAVAADGLQAIARYVDDAYAFVLMDCEMPVCDGFEASGRIRYLEHAFGRPPVPIIGISAEVAYAREAYWRPVGMSSFLAKPFDLQTLRREIIAQLRAARPSA
jgi:CheY-like chemotaxis protein